MKPIRKTFQALAFILAGFIIFTIMVGGFYCLSIPFFAVPIFQNLPARIVGGIVIVGIPAILTTQFMRMVYYTIHNETDRW